MMIRNLGLGGVCLLVIGLMLYKPLDLLPMMIDSTKVSGVLFLCYIIFYFLRFRHHPRPHRNIVSFLIITIISILVFIFGTICTLNGVFDSSPLQKHTETILHLYSNHGRSKIYYIEIPSWRYPNQRETLQVPAEEFEKIIPTQTKIHFSTRSGFFNYVWIDNYTLEF